MTGQPDPRTRPRRRGRVLEEAIIQAAADELTELGYAGMTMESVARRAGAGKVSVYRRWPSRLELAAEVAYRRSPELHLPPEPSSLREDLRTCVRALTELAQGPVGEAMRGVIIDSLTAPDSPRLADLSRGRGAEVLEGIVARARARGEVAQDLTYVQLQVPTALVYYHLITRRDPDPTFLHAVIDEVIIPMIQTSAGQAAS